MKNKWEKHWRREAIFNPGTAAENLKNWFEQIKLKNNPRIVALNHFIEEVVAKKEQIKQRLKNINIWEVLSEERKRKLFLIIGILLIVCGTVFNAWSLEPLEFSLERLVIVSAAIACAGAFLIHGGLWNLSKIVAKETMKFVKFIVFSVALFGFVIAGTGLGLIRAAQMGLLDESPRSQYEMVEPHTSMSNPDDEAVEDGGKTGGLIDFVYKVGFIIWPLLGISIEIAAGLAIYNASERSSFIRMAAKDHFMLEKLARKHRRLEKKKAVLESEPDEMYQQGLEAIRKGLEDVRRDPNIRNKIILAGIGKVLLYILLGAGIVLLATTVFGCETTSMLQDVTYAQTSPHSFSEGNAAMGHITLNSGVDTHLFAAVIHRRSYTQPIVLLNDKTPKKRGYMDRYLTRAHHSFHGILKQNLELARPDVTGTDIIGALRLVQEVVSVNQCDNNRIFIFSDMLLVDTSLGLNFERLSRIDDKQRETILEKMPPVNLSGSQIYIHGVDLPTRSTQFFDELRALWTQYLESKCGAEVKQFSPLFMIEY